MEKTEDYGIYADLVLKITGRVRILLTSQLETCLYRSFENLKRDGPAKILREMQKNGDIILSSDGYALTKGAYTAVSGDRFCECLNNGGTYRAGALGHDIDAVYPDAGRLIDCMWVAADLMPYSKRLITGLAPWDLMFDTAAGDGLREGGARLYEIMKIPKGSEEIYFEIIRCLPKVGTQGLRNAITRIAVMDDGEKADMLPHRGFGFAVTPDPASPRGVKTVMKRTGGDIWSGDD